MGGEDTADTAVGHATAETQAWAVARPGVHEFGGFGADDDRQYEDCLPYHPENELPSTEKKEELVQVVRGLANGAEDGYEDCSCAY